MREVQEDFKFYEEGEEEKLKAKTKSEIRENFDNPEEWWDLLNAAKKVYHNKLAISKNIPEPYVLTEAEIELLNPKKSTKPTFTQELAMENIKKDLIKELVDEILKLNDKDSENYHIKRIRFLKDVGTNPISKNIYKQYLGGIIERDKLLENHLKRFEEAKQTRPNIIFKELKVKEVGFNSLPEEVKDEYVKRMYKVVLFRFYCLIREDLIRKITRDYFDSEIIKIGKYEEILRNYGTPKYNSALNSYVLKNIIPQKSYEIVSTLIKDTMEGSLPIIQKYNPEIKENYMTEIYIHHSKNYDGAARSIAIEMFSKVPESVRLYKEEKEAEEAEAEKAKAQKGRKK